MDNELTREILKAETKCFNAVTHVGAANYDDREAESIMWVREAFRDVTALLEKERAEGRREVQKEIGEWLIQQSGGISSGKSGEWVWFKFETKYFEALRKGTWRPELAQPEEEKCK